MAVGVIDIMQGAQEVSETLQEMLSAKESLTYLDGSGIGWQPAESKKLSVSLL